MRLFIADPALSSFQGHHFSLTKTFSDAAAEHGFRVIWLTSKRLPNGNFDLPANVTIERAFSSGTYDAHKPATASKLSGKSTSAPTPPTRGRLYYRLQQLYSRLPDGAKVLIRNSLQRFRPFNTLFSEKPSEKSGVAPAQAKPRACDELINVLSKYGAGTDDCILFHTCDAQTYLDIVELFTKALPFQRWTEIPTLLLSTPYDESVMPHNRTGVKAESSIRYLKLFNLIDTQIFLYAENDLLAEHLAAQWNVRVCPLFIPQKPAQVQDEASPNGAITFTYLGAAREEKGFLFLADGIERLLSISQRQDIRFEIQASPQIIGYPKNIQAAVERLLSLDDHRLQLITESQTPAAYDAALLRADVILICYDPTRYAVRSSGIVAEALANGKITMVSASSFPQHISKESGRAVSYGDIDDFVRCTLDIIENFDRYQLQARNRSSGYLQEVDPKCFFREIKDVRMKFGKECTSTSGLPSDPGPTNIPYRNLI